MKALVRITLVASLLIIGLLGTTTAAFADPPEDKEEGFVCPVLGGKAGVNGEANGIAKPADTGLDFATVLGPNVDVPTQATNGKNGTNNPGGPYASPGDSDYTAIWPNRP